MLPNRLELMPAPCPEAGKKVHYFITMVKFNLGKGAMDFMKAADRVDKTLPGGPRHSRGIHEEMTFVTLGRYDMVMIWYAPDLSIMVKYWQELIDACGADLGQTETLVAISKGAPNDV